MSTFDWVCVFSDLDCPEAYCTLATPQLLSSQTQQVYTFSFIVGNIIPKSVKCSTQLLRPWNDTILLESGFGFGSQAE